MVIIFAKLKEFWTNFWQALKKAYSKIKEPIHTEVQDWQDIDRTNLLDVFVGKLNNLTNTQATFDIESDSTQTEELKRLCKDLEHRRYAINEMMLGEGDCFVLPAMDEQGKLYHSYIPQARVRIVSMDADRITEACCILDWEKQPNGNIYSLVRHHKLEPDGTLYIDYMTLDQTGKKVYFDKWDYLSESTNAWKNANHIGFGRYKSPISSRGLSPVYGVPLNFGCGDIEQRIMTDLKLIDDEFKNGKSVIFTDPKNIRQDKDGCPKGMDNIIPVQARSGEGANIDIFNPTLRFSEHYGKLMADFALYEKQIGTSKGILTENETTETATATAVKRANADTLSMLDNIRNAIDDGNEMTLEADGIYLNVSKDLWHYTSDWFDPFEDPDIQWQRLIEAKQNGAAETEDMIQWLFPDMTEEEIADKIERIGTKQAADTEGALERILMGR